MRRWLASGQRGALLALFALRPAAAQTGAKDARTPEQRVEEVTRLVASAQFDAADAAAVQALSSGELQRGDLARLYRELGVLAAARGDKEAAGSAFRKALALDPTLTLSPAAGPHIVELLEGARRARAGRPEPVASARLTPGSTAGELLVEARVQHDAERLASQVALDAAGHRTLYALGAAGLDQAVVIDEAKERCIEVRASVVDELGNSIWNDLARTQLCPPASAKPAAVGPPAERAPARPGVVAERESASTLPLWIGVAVTGGLAVATGVLGAVALDKEADFDDKNADPAFSTDDREAARADALSAQHRATIAGVATAVAGGVTLTLFLTRPSDPEPALDVQAGLGSLALRGRF